MANDLCEELMYWSAGSEFGLLTFIGYLAFVSGLAITWRSREDLSVWILEEVGDVRRSFFSRYTVIGPFYTVREESRLKTVPSYFARSLRRIPRSPVSAGAILLILGPLLLVLDFFI
jgi:hypothetical protein